ncbi:MAG: DUF4384 domain-containing protein [Alloprevotella sp.]|nr:DUF4384 domain-containing protein [Alloprevotella sp.]
MKHILLVAVLTCFPFVLRAGDGTKKVGGEFIYYADASLSLKEAKSLAIENAKLQAIAKEFGTIITQDTRSSDHLTESDERSYFLQLNSAEVKGEWVEDLKEPVCEVVEVLSDMLVIKTVVSGRARAISNDACEFEVKVLRNGTEARFADTNFKNGDDLFLSFRAPVSGYIAVYLIDEAPEAYCLLPYSKEDSGQQFVRHGREHIFFSPAHATPQDIYKVDELNMTCSDANVEHNQLYVIFSPNPFTKALDEQQDELIPRHLSFKDFSKWLSKCRKRDKNMGVQVIHLTIRNNE